MLYAGINMRKLGTHTVRQIDNSTRRESYKL